MSDLSQLLREQTVEHWGETCTFKPELVKRHWGDGGRLVQVFPINERPRYWVVRVDSKCDDLFDDDDLLDEIYEAIDEQFGAPSEDDLGIGDERPYFPMHDGQGCSWHFPNAKAEVDCE